MVVVPSATLSYQIIVGEDFMIRESILVLALLVLHTYEARIRFEGKITTTQVKASDAGQAKKLVQQQFPKATVLSVKKVD
jgi:hypothetical protein